MLSLRTDACHPEAAGSTYFVANPEPVSWTAFARATADAAGRKVTFLRLPAGVA